MRLTFHTDYALRMLIFLALREGEQTTIREIAEAYGISRNHLMKVAHKLQQQGYLHTTRGRGGGLSLARPAQDIRLGRLVKAMEPDLALAECFGPDNQCVITPHCRLKGVLGKALKSFLDTLDEHTLAELTGRGARALKRDLGLIPVRTA